MKKILTLLISMIVLTACSETMNYEYKFVGDSEHWEAVYSYKGKEKWGDDDGQRTYSNEASYEFVLKYKGPLEKLSFVKEVEYSFEENFGGGNGTVEFTDPPTEIVITAKGKSTGTVKVDEDEVIKVNVKWVDLEESFELYNKNK